MVITAMIDIHIDRVLKTEKQLAMQGVTPWSITVGKEAGEPRRKGGQEPYSCFVQAAMAWARLASMVHAGWLAGRMDGCNYFHSLRDMRDEGWR